VLDKEFMHALAPRVLCGMSGLPFGPIPKTDEAKAYRTLVSEFTDDPVERWLYPELSEYLAHFPQFLAAFGGRAFDEQTVWRLGEGSAVALWLPPGSKPDGDAITSVLTETASPDKHDDAFAVLEQMDVAHPTYPHWYLPWFGVDPALQGKGLGGELMDHCLGIVDTSYLPAYLETPNPRNLSFYKRHGFEVMGVAQAGECPPITLMLRGAP
jgi:ribosomal protein S18 acetylase RimI-like enzyme